MDSLIHSALSRPGNIVFPGNLPYVTDFAKAGGHAIRQPSGHLIFYSQDHRRFLATDPEGNPLHECEWATTPGGTQLVRARVRLDWGQWVGIKPDGLVNATTLDLSKKRGWERLRADDLRKMAADAMHVSVKEVKFFYTDDDLVIDQQRGQATIRHRKDAFYILDDGTFMKARFMACMSALHWARIDFLPVVELFQSLLPGTGSATFELIRSLYDDQNEGKEEPLLLRYRGIPTYPSEAAYRLFSTVFFPQVRGGGNPLPVFMDAPRSHEVTWTATADPPLRYFDPARNLCVTVRGGVAQKVTVADDPAVPFVRPNANGFASCQRSVQSKPGKLLLQDGAQRTEISTKPSWGVTKETPAPQPPTASAGWRAFFDEQVPAVNPADAFSAVLLYPDDESEIGEAASQPFVADYLQDLLDQLPDLAALAVKATRVLIDNFDAALLSCISLDHPRDYTVRYTNPALAKKHAQSLWNQLAQGQRLEWMSRIRFRPAETGPPQAAASADLFYKWVPFAEYPQTTALGQTARGIAATLTPGGLAFVTGPMALSASVPAVGLRLLHQQPVAALPTFRIHQAILPKARLKVDLTLFLITKG